MRLEKNTVLITGGASGIGLGIARRFLRAGSRVIVCGRREEKLREARNELPDLVIRTCDLVRRADREALCDWAIREFPDLNVLVNNAGIQLWFSLDDPPDWERLGEEIAINLEAPMHLTMLLTPHLRARPAAAIWNVSSGLAFAPLAAVPVYSATKAALHSFTLSLRHALAKTSVGVIEIVPPAVRTDLGGPGIHDFATPVDEFLDAVFPRIEAGETEVGYGFSDQSRQASRADLDRIFERMNRPSGSGDRPAG